VNRYGIFCVDLSVIQSEFIPPITLMGEIWEVDKCCIAILMIP
jgi:hypothetical protein